MAKIVHISIAPISVKIFHQKDVNTSGQKNILIITNKDKMIWNKNSVRIQKSHKKAIFFLASDYLQIYSKKRFISINFEGKSSRYHLRCNCDLTYREDHIQQAIKNWIYGNVSSISILDIMKISTFSCNPIR